jgi:hypothetical protein
MKTKNQFIGIAVAASLMFFTNCNKEKLTTPSPEPAAVQNDNPDIGAKTSLGFSVISLRNTSTVTGVCEINSGYNITSPTSGLYQTVTIGGPSLTFVTGIVTIFLNTTTMFGVTGFNSNKPGALVKIDIATKTATYVGQTSDNFGNQIFLQDIERTTNGMLYYAIEVGTNNIYRCLPGSVGTPPLVWTLATTLPPAAGATSAFHGLDIIGNLLVVYGNGNVTASPYPNVAGNIGYYCRYTIGVGGSLTNVGNAGTNIGYAISANEDAALLINKDPSLTGFFVMIATPSFSNLHYHNPNMNLPYILNNITTGFASLNSTGPTGLVDYAYF